MNTRKFFLPLPSLLLFSPLLSLQTISFSRPGGGGRWGQSGQHRTAAAGGARAGLGAGGGAVGPQARGELSQHRLASWLQQVLGRQATQPPAVGAVLHADVVDAAQTAALPRLPRAPEALSAPATTCPTMHGAGLLGTCVIC